MKGSIMAAFHLLLVICCIGGISGQTVLFDVGSGFYQLVDNADATEAIAIATSTDDTTRQSCVIGSITYYTEGSTVINANDDTVLLTADADQTIVSITCCCNLISIALQATDEISGDETHTGTWFWTIFTDRNYIIIKVLEDDITTDVQIKCSLDFKRIFVVSITKVYFFNLDDLLTIVYVYDFTPALEGLRDFACCGSGDDFDLYIVTTSFQYTVAVWTSSGPSAGLTQRSGTTPSDGASGRNVAITISGDNVYLLTVLVRISGVVSYEWVLGLYVKDDFNSESTITGNALDLTDTTVPSSHNLKGGLFVIESVTCDTATCLCDSDCGACADTTTECQCTNSLSDACCYTDDTISAACEACIEALDVCVFVRNPLALRRNGPSIDIVGVATFDVDIAITRQVDTGRYNAPNLPQHVKFSKNDNDGPLWIHGYSFPVQRSGRGRRFGVYAVDFQDTMNPTVVSAIATENSGFRNTRYCYTVNKNDEVSLKATFAPQLRRFTNTLRWQYIHVDQSSNSNSDPATPACDFDPDRLTCKLTNVTKDTDEGVYEVYRPGRRLRNWHPLIYLFVRECEADLWGSDCSRGCVACEQGWCDTNCGTCVCFPGWMGDDCNTACDNGDLVGATCNIKCSDVFYDTTDCKGLLIEKPAKVPCSCRSGLMPPECLENCEDGYWGPNCANECDTCDARTGG